MRIIFAVMFTVAPVGYVDAGPFRRRGYSQPVQSQAVPAQTVAGPTGEPSDSLAEVNAKRAARGLPPYTFDPLLTQAAMSCATYRASRGISGHVMHGSGDFQFLPLGATADAAGCAAVDASWGFLACEVYGSYRFAGAATVRGANGILFHHLFLKR